MGGTKTSSRAEQAEDWTLEHSLEPSKTFGWTGTHFLTLTHAGEKKKKEKKLAHGKTIYSRKKKKT